MKYPVLIEVNNVIDGYTLAVVDLPGCKVEAANVDEGLNKLKSAVDNHLEILAEYGIRRQLAWPVHDN